MRIKFTESNKIIPDAYHGTKYDYALKISKENKFIPAADSNAFLGSGVYFFESSIWHAKEWAKKKYVGEDVGIINAVINLGRCLDLHNQEHKFFLADFRERLKKKGKDIEITDALVINLITTINPEIDTVRVTHIQAQYKKIFEESRFFDYSQLIICVKNLNRILKITLVQ